LLLDADIFQNERSIDFSVGERDTDVAEASEKISGFCEACELSSKETMYLSLTIEEILMLINKYSYRVKEEHYSDVRIVVTEDEVTLRIRNIGERFNPVAYYYETMDHQGREDDGENDMPVDEIIGIGMIIKIAKHIEYFDTYGINNLAITIQKG
jgi:hypothetical protein